MANVAFKKGLLATLPSTYAEGTFYVTTDERAIYLDVSDSARIRLGDFQEFKTLAELQANTNPSTTALYYVSDLNVLAKWNGTEYVQINLDTGATSVEISGSGNAVTAASYNATTRKLTLTMGETFATAAELEALDAYVGDIPEGYTESNVIAYINKKAQETLDAASGGSSESAASVLAALNTYKAENDPKVQANTDAIDAIEADYLKAADKTELQGNIDGIAGRVTTAEGEIDTLQADLTGEIARAKAAEQANASAAKAADDKAVAAQDSVDTLAGKVGDVPADKTVVQMIADAQSAATYDDTELAGRVSANEDAIDLLNDGADVEGSVDYKIAQAVAAIMENPDETMNSINELVTWVNDHAADALELSNKVEANEDDIAALELLVGETAVATQITDAIAGALKIDGVDKYALAADLTAAIGRIAAAEGKITTLEGKAHTHTFNEAELNKIQDGDVEKWNGAQAAAEATAAGALAAAKQELEGKITAEANRADGVEKALSDRLDVLEAIDHEAYKSYADQAEADAISAAQEYADGLAGNYDASGAAAAVQGETDKTVKDVVDILTWGSF